MSNPFAISGNIVFYNGKVIKDCDGVTFKNLGGGYSCDSKNIYCREKAFLKIDSLDEFESLGDGYAKTFSKVYLWGKEISGALPLTFEYLGNGYSHDQYNAYHNSNHLSKAKTGCLVIPPMPEKKEIDEGSDLDGESDTDEECQKSKLEKQIESNTKHGQCLTLRHKGKIDLTGKQMYFPQ